MGKYLGSPWGKIRGILNGAVGGAWRGIDWNRVLVFPTQRGTLKKYRQFKAGSISNFSYAQMNIRRAVLSPLGYIGRMHLGTFIYTIWDEFVTRHSLKMTGLNVFVMKNAPNMYASMPHKDQEYNATTNAPDLTVIKASDGDLEPTPALGAQTYVVGTGVLTLNWDKDTFGNGKATDLVYVVVLRKPILESFGVSGTWAPKLWLYGPLQVAGKTRVDETGTVTLPPGLTIADLTAYVFFKDAAGEIGYSPSVAKAVTAP